ncbi:hypothetical protein G6O67_000450 [Ophiocordyceps sinensis]|uniref:Uncharacterized protein n=1 Tax=Ophiocordyceps sinensis TaxID=72228 RepID=A0A8H4V9Z7_9HYPO|nr:hypothetical protein G6O67_000450 [Ophiocordyceps sinensis]
MQPFTHNIILSSSRCIPCRAAPPHEAPREIPTSPLFSRVPTRTDAGRESSLSNTTLSYPLLPAFPAAPRRGMKHHGSLAYQNRIAVLGIIQANEQAAFPTQCDLERAPSQPVGSNPAYDDCLRHRGVESEETTHRLAQLRDKS